MLYIKSRKNYAAYKKSAREQSSLADFEIYRKYIKLSAQIACETLA